MNTRHSIRAVITGSTGMIGKGVLLECLDDPRVSRVLVVNRNRLNMSHPKLSEVLLPDFGSPDAIRDALSGYDVAFFCLGVSAAGLKPEAYHRITYDYTVDFAKVFLQANPDSTFIYISGAGTDSTEKGRTMWARVKGKTENALLSMGFRQAFMLRPGVIRPLRGIRSRTRLYKVAYQVLRPFWPVLLALFKNQITDTTRIGKAMISLAIHGGDRTYYENRDINAIASA